MAISPKTGNFATFAFHGKDNRFRGSERLSLHLHCQQVQNGSSRLGEKETHLEPIFWRHHQGPDFRRDMGSKMPSRSFQVAERLPQTTGADDSSLRLSC